MVNICHSCAPGFWLISPPLSSLGCPKSPRKRELGSAAFSAEVLLLLSAIGCCQASAGGVGMSSLCVVGSGCCSQKEFGVLFSSLSTCCERQSLDIGGVV